MIFEAFKRMRAERPRAAAFLLSSGDRAYPITWRQFTDDIAAVVQLIEDHVGSGTVAIIGENSYEWMVVHAATVFSNATVTPLDANLTAQEISDRLKFVGARMLVYSSLYQEKVAEVRRLTPGLATAGFGTRKTDRYLEHAYKVVEKRGVSVWDKASVDTERVSMLVFTSGTTSEPRGAMLTLHAMESFIEWAVETLDVRPGQRSLMLLPLHHIFGIGVVYFMLSRGVALGICPDFRRIYDAFERFRVNFAFLVPALADILAQKIQQKAPTAEAALGMPIDWILIGGAALPRRTYEHLTSLGVKMLTGYGLTETCAAYSITPTAGDPHVGAQGIASRAKDVETKVSESGELLIRGPVVMKGYFREPEKTAKVLDKDGWYHTGDLGSIDRDGFVWITGRASRTIILSSGKKIAPEELEEKLLAIPGLREAVVTGEGQTREIRAEVYAAISEKAVRKAIGDLNLLLPVYKRISTVIVRKDPFPRTSSGKIRLG